MSGRFGRLSTPSHPALRRALPSVAVIVAYFVIALVAFWPALSGFSVRIFGNEGDFVEAIWFIGWPAHALVHGLNPFFTHVLNVPFGVNLAQNTEAPLLGWVTAPISLLFSPQVAANLLLLVGMPLSATAAFVVLRRWAVWLPAAGLGGLMYGFSTYMVAQAQGHPQLMVEPLPPLIALTLVSILQGRGNPRRLGIALGLLVTAQYLISPELLAIVAIFAVVAVACVAVRHPTQVPALARAAARPVGLALAIIAVCLAYPVWMLLAGPQHVSGPTIPLSNPFHNDLLSFVVPGPLNKVTLGMKSLETRVLGYNDSTEAGGYIGIPVLILAGIFAWTSRRRARTQLAVVLFLVAVVLSLGPTLTLNGRLTSVRLPFWVLAHFPLLRDILPGRISFVAAGFLGAVIAFGLDDLRRAPADGDALGAARQDRRRYASVVGAALVLVALVVTQLPKWPYATDRMPALSASVTRVVPARDPVAITYPYDTASVTEPMFWQADDGFRFQLLGGYVYIRGPHDTGAIYPARMNPPGLQQFLTAQGGNPDLYGRPPPLGPALVATTRATIAKYHIRLVIVDAGYRGAGPVIRLFTEALGPPRVVGPVVVWADWPHAPKR